MSKPDDIELGQDRYRPVFTRPLASPRMLWGGVAFFGLASIIGAWFPLGPWGETVFLTVPVMLGVCLAGLFPSYWFRKDR